jgi:hypothetical protein
MRKSALYLIILVAFGLFLSACGGDPNGGMILFYGDGCPHCAIVDKFIADNKVDEKIKFTQKEVFRNQGNSRLMAQKAASCGLKADKIGVPLLWTGAACYMGDLDIIKFFQEKINES